MQQVYLDTFKLHDLDDNSYPVFLMPPIDGLDFTAMRIGSNPRAGEDGISINSSYQGERRAGLIGKIADSATLEEHLEYRRALIAACAPTRDSNGLIVLKELHFTDLVGNHYRLLGEVIPRSMPTEQIDHSTFMIDFLAHSKYVEGYDLNSLTINPLTHGGFVLPVVLPIVFSAGSGGAGTAINGGNAPASPVITLDGPLTNPRIENSTTGEFLALNITLSAAEQLVIDMAEPSIVQGGETNKMSSKSGGTFWTLAPGENIIRLTTGVDGEDGTALVEWRNAFYGA